MVFSINVLPLFTLNTVYDTLPRTVFDQNVIMFHDNEAEEHN